jgi:hypothetical protein
VLQRVLAAVDTVPVPERSEAYGAEVWQRLRPRLPAHPHRDWLERMGFRSLVRRARRACEGAVRGAGVPASDRAGVWGGAPRGIAPQWAMAGGLAVLLVAAFVAGRYSTPTIVAPTPTTAEVSTRPGRVRERVLLVAVGDHLERSQIVLAELVNAPSTSPEQASPGQHPGTVDISSQQAWATELVASNRLYRQTASQTGETGVETMLDELEPIFIEIANSPSAIASEQLEELRQRIEAQGLLFKIHILGSTVRERTAAPDPGRLVS